MQPKVSPSNLDFGAVAPGNVGPTRSTSISEAPADARVSASISGGDAFFFNVIRMANFQRTLEPVDRSELPPGFKGHPKHIVLDQVGESDGTTPLQVSKGQFVTIDVGVTAPFGLAGRDTLLSTLLIQGDTWDLVTVPLSMLLAHIETSFPAGTDVRFELGEANLPISVRSVAGPDPAPVTYAVIPRPDLSEAGVSAFGQQTFQITGRGPNAKTLLFHIDDPTKVKVGQFIHGSVTPQVGR